MNSSLPIETVLPDLLAVLRVHTAAVLTAAPGAGKTTRVPPALIDEHWMSGRKLIMLEPRRLAARHAAEYMASLLGERVGGTVGYRIRGETRVGPTTRVEVVTEGILTRVLLEHQDLPGVGAVLFDEFHERSIHADLGLAFTLDVQRHLRPDLRILVMSATLDQLSVADILGNAPVVRSEGVSYPVVTKYEGVMSTGPIEPRVRDAVRRALREQEGDILVFLPGQREIRRTAELIQQDRSQTGYELHLLYGDASPHQQRAAFEPPRAGMRKIILSTSIAETSLTINGVSIAIDAGLSRQPRFDPRRGMVGLVTVPVSQASADQRRGRAGRQGPGVCYRLWSEASHGSLPRFTPPEILSADLLPVALDLARWGDPMGENLSFLDRPREGNLKQARGVLASLGALDDQGALTGHGRAMGALPVHPRLAHMMLKAKELGCTATACMLAALLSERDLLRGESGMNVDLLDRWEALRDGRSADPILLARINGETARLFRLMGDRRDQTGGEPIGMLVALAYPDRVAQRKRDGDGYLLANGTGAVLPVRSRLSQEQFLAVAEVDGVGVNARILLAAPLRLEDLQTAFEDRFLRRDETVWDPLSESVVSRRLLMLGSLVLEERAIPPDPSDLTRSLLQGIRTMGLDALPWDRESRSFRARSEWLRTHRDTGGSWPALDDESLLQNIEGWLAPFLGGTTRRAQLSQLPMLTILSSMFSHAQREELDKLAPERLTVPTGSRIRLQYESSDRPVLAVKLQELFGQTATPTVCGGHVPVLIHLLSPAGRPLAVTQDLPSFWRNSYPEVRKEMRGRYPRHQWPEDPLQAAPSKGVKKRSRPSRGDTKRRK
jgi:ATP-dependent helicase HrpB